MIIAESESLLLSLSVCQSNYGTISHCFSTQDAEPVHYGQTDRHYQVKALRTACVGALKIVCLACRLQPYVRF